MGALKQYIQSFVKRGGILIALSTFLSKFSTAILSIVVVRILTQEQYSDVAYLLSFYAILIVFAGLGGNYSLMRYGSISNSYLEKKNLYYFALKKGVIATFFISLLCSVFFYFYSKDDFFIPFLIMSLSIITYYQLEVLKSYYRIFELNKIYARINTYSSLVSLILVLICTYLFATNGYFIGLLISPLLIFFFFSRKISQPSKLRDIFDKKKFWSYGLHTSISAFANQIIFSIAPILIAILSTNKLEIGIFKVATIIPFNVLTLPGILMQTDFTAIAKNSNDRKYLVDYYLNYLKIFGLCSLPFFALSIYFGKEIITVIFGKEYIDAAPMFNIFMIATYFSYILRNPLGNILLAVGKAKWNGYNTYFFCIFYIVASWLFYNQYNVYSFVYSLAIVFIFSGVVALFMFIKYLRIIK